MHRFDIKKRLMIVFACLFSFNALAELVVVVHPSNETAIDKQLVKQIFLGKEKKFSNGVLVVPINQKADQAIKSEFDTSFLNKSDTQITAYWAKRVFTGKGSPPQEVENSVNVLEIVSLNSSAIGYVDSSVVTEAVKVIKFN